MMSGFMNLHSTSPQLQANASRLTTWLTDPAPMASGMKPRRNRRVRWSPWFLVQPSLRSETHESLALSICVIRDIRGSKQTLLTADIADDADNLRECIARVMRSA